MARKTINQKLEELENNVKKYIAIIKAMQKQMEESKNNKPYSKNLQPIKFGNMDLIFDGTDKIWKTYAIYKDEEEEE